MNGLYRRFATALGFLTILPVPYNSSQTVDSVDLARSFALFPPAGLVIGACCLLCYLPLRAVMPPLLIAVVLTALLALLTRGLHLDGLADLADGAGGGYTPERRLEIMKDSRIGTFGAVALALAMLFKAAGLQALAAADNWPPIVLVPVFSRLTMVLAAYKSPYARPQGGLGKPFVEHMTAREPVIATVFACLAALFFGPRLTLLYLAAVLMCAGMFRFLGRRLLGGVTGDVLGAANEVSEILLLALSACTLPGS